MTKKFFAFVTILLALAAFSESRASTFNWPSESPLFCDPNGNPSAIVSGQVRDVTNLQPISGNYVTLTDGTNANVCQVALTSSFGYFAFEPTFANGQAYSLSVVQSKKCPRGQTFSFTLSSDRFFDILIDCQNLNFP